MKRIIISIILFFGLSILIYYIKFSPIKKSVPVHTQQLFSQIKKINDDLYVGKVADTFYLALERITPKNISMWQQFADNQVAVGSSTKFEYLPSTEGSVRFKSVLDAYSDGTIDPSNELWVAYGSIVPVTKAAELTAHENPSIDMFMSVVTSPDAILTSHMGISRTWQAAQALADKSSGRIKYPDQSLHLHSFAAKVMKLRDPKKVYMITTPAAAMRNIIINKMPHNSVFVGDNLYRQAIEAADAKDKIVLLQSNPPRIVRTSDGKNQAFTIYSADEKPLITFDQSSSAYQWLFTESYADEGILLPYILVDLAVLAAFGKLL